ncbi:glycosyltransferase [Candidatus Poribacteria bacterium]|nr:glycosyltransferase [Candidatus Poribacteria bacterium]
MAKTGRKLKILHVTNSISMGGAEAHLLCLLGRLDRSAFEPVYAYLDDSAGWSDSLVSQFEDRGIPSVSLKTGSLLDLRAFGRLANLMKAGRFDIVHVHLLRSQLYGIPAARWSGVPSVIVSVHNTSRRFARFPTNSIAKISFAMADRIIAISRAVGEHLVRNGCVSNGKLRVIHYGYDVKQSSDPGTNDLRNQLRLPPGTKLLGVVARLMPPKGHRYLFDALPEVLKANKEAHLLVIGGEDTAIAGALRAQVHDLHLDEKITFLGYRADVAAILPQLDLFVLPSLSEGFGLVLLEAMAAGLPVVSTMVDAIPEIVEHGVTGLLVPPAQSRPLAEAINKILGRPYRAREMGAAGRKRAEQCFSVAKMVSETEQLYREVARGKGLLS